MRVPSNGSPVVNTRGPTRTPDSIASRSSCPSNALVAGLRTVVMPNDSQMRPSASPYALVRCAWLSISPGSDRAGRRVHHRAAMQVVAMRLDRA